MSEPTSSSPRPAESNRFFTWLRGLGIARADGWAGGVCGGIALRTGLDPLIVRGIAVVIAILGGPALFFYAVAWLLLPDTHGEIHLERMLRGIFDAPLIAIAVLVALTFVPFTQGVWWLGGHITGAVWWLAAPAEALRVLWNLAIVAAIVWFLVWLGIRYRNAPPGSRPFGRPRGSAPAPAPAGSTDAGYTDAGSGAAGSGPAGSGTAGSAGAAAAAEGTAAFTTTPNGTTETTATMSPTTTHTGAPGTEAPGAPPVNDDLARWRQQYAAWREQHAAWQEQQRAASQSERTARSAESRARSQAYAAEAAERRRVRAAANPRAAGWVVALVLGAALVAGGIAGTVAAADAGLARYAAPIGLATALMVIGLGMVVAGIARRRSGALATLAIVTVVIGLGSFGWPVHDSAAGFTQLRADRDASVSQFAGQIEVDAAAADLGGGTRTIHVTQTFGAVAVYVGDGVDAHVRVTSAGSRIRSVQLGADGTTTRPREVAVGSGAGSRTAQRTWSNTNGGSPELVIDITQGRGAVYVYDGGGARPNSGHGYLD
ncbi:PspC domain-containing protein [Gryllotalpicola reticulitermitis]|uniref:PspC domain-containing protein n=1 Tax=Gryllotalpicola reticulitermitis TaxID=1184153 RepID=A0ABV8Q8J2_9MICO